MLANWGIMTKPFHPVLLKTLENIVEVIRREYLRLPAIFMLPTEPRWKAVHCATGPMLLTSSVFETMQRDHVPFNDTNYLRVAEKDFQQFDGVFKVSYEEKYMPHTHCKLMFLFFF